MIDIIQNKSKNGILIGYHAGRYNNLSHGKNKISNFKKGRVHPKYF